MTESLRQRFLDICRFRRTGDLCLLAPWLNDFWVEVPSVWVHQGAPAELEDPHKNLRCVHIAGTKGKGSTP